MLDRAFDWISTWRMLYVYDIWERKMVQVITKTICLRWVLCEYMFDICVFCYILAISWMGFPRLSDTLPCAHKPFVDHAVNCCHLTLVRPLWVLFGSVPQSQPYLWHNADTITIQNRACWYLCCHDLPYYYKETQENRLHESIYIG